MQVDIPAKTIDKLQDLIDSVLMAPVTQLQKELALEVMKDFRLKPTEKSDMGEVASSSLDTAELRRLLQEMGGDPGIAQMLKEQQIREAKKRMAQAVKAGLGSEDPQKKFEEVYIGSFEPSNLSQEELADQMRREIRRMEQDHLMAITKPLTIADIEKPKPIPAHKIIPPTFPEPVLKKSALERAWDVTKKFS